MREIKFRLWNGFRMIDDEELSKNASDLFINSGKSDQYENDVCIPRTNSLKVMQYIGLKDKNDKEIYEGDIIYFLDELYNENKHEYVNYFNVGEVIWNKQTLSWDVTNRNWYRENIWHYSEHIEVRGNICENKDFKI